MKVPTKLLRCKSEWPIKICTLHLRFNTSLLAALMDISFILAHYFLVVVVVVVGISKSIVCSIRIVFFLLSELLTV